MTMSWTNDSMRAALGSSARGMHSSLSPAGKRMRPAPQSALARSMRSRDDDTKLHSRERGPAGSPPSTMRRVARAASNEGGAPGVNISIWPASKLREQSGRWLEAQVPDVRLKIERPTLAELSTWDADPRVRGVEFRLPLTGVWMGYETPVEGEDPRATLSIQRGF